MTDKLRAAAEMALEALLEIDDCPRGVDQATIPKAGIEAAPHQVVFNMSIGLLRLRKAQKAIQALRQALDQLPDTTKMMGLIPSEWAGLEKSDIPIDRGAWSDVPDATKWVDELRGGEDLDEPPQPIGEVQIEELGRPYNAGKVILHFYGEPPPVGTKLYAAPPKREWVSLTEEEIYPMYCEPRSDAEMIAFAREFEAKLKEKNT